MKPTTLLQHKLRNNHDKTKAHLEATLLQYKQQVDRALVALKADEVIDEHLVCNMVHTTAIIANYNMVRDIFPYLKNEDDNS